MTNTSLTPVTATVSTPLALMAATLLRKLGMCRLMQVGVKAPGTANSATFLPLNTSSVVFGLRAFGGHHAECCVGQFFADLDGHGRGPLAFADAFPGGKIAQPAN